MAHNTSTASPDFRNTYTSLVRCLFPLIHFDLNFMPSIYALSEQAQRNLMYYSCALAIPSCPSTRSAHARQRVMKAAVIGDGRLFSSQPRPVRYSSLSASSATPSRFPSSFPRTHSPPHLSSPFATIHSRKELAMFNSPLTTAALFALGATRAALASPCVAFDTKWNLLAFGLNGKDWNAGQLHSY